VRRVQPTREMLPVEKAALNHPPLCLRNDAAESAACAMVLANVVMRGVSLCSGMCQRRSESAHKRRRPKTGIELCPVVSRSGPSFDELSRLRGDNQDGPRVAASRNAPEGPGRCLNRTLPRHHRNVNRCRIGLSLETGSAGVGPRFPVRSSALLSRPDLAAP
jgi:hypothetical protein